MRGLSALSAVAIGLGVIGFAGTVLAQDGGEPDLFFEGDMVRGATQDGATGVTCVLTSQFKRGESVVWRLRLMDEEGEPLGEEEVESLVVEIPSGEKFDMTYGWHPRKEKIEQFWATSWRIPSDYPTGSLGYKVVAKTKDGTTETWEPFKIPSSQLTVIEGEVTYTK